MPLPAGTRYRWKTEPSGKKVRLAFAAGTNKVIEVKKKGGVAHLTDLAANLAAKGQLSLKGIRKRKAGASKPKTGTY